MRVMPVFGVAILLVAASTSAAVPPWSFVSEFAAGTVAGVVCFAGFVALGDVEPALLLTPVAVEAAVIAVGALFEVSGNIGLSVLLGGGASVIALVVAYVDIIRQGFGYPARPWLLPACCSLISLGITFGFNLGASVQVATPAH